MNLSFYRGKTVFVTGHTGFKGSWLSEILLAAGAKVIGYALSPSTEPSLYRLLDPQNRMISVIGDVRDIQRLSAVFEQYKPEIVLHLAAQPIVRVSYALPRETYETNVMGTVNICECVRQTPSVKSFVNVTTDKVYENDDILDHPFKEEEKLDGFDPYSNSKSCSELVTHSYYKSFLKERGVAASTARAGNVIGGGDFSVDRIVPDCARALKTGTPLILRNPLSTRPYQHVLEPLSCYLLLAEKQYYDHSVCGAYNIGPDPSSFRSTENLVHLFQRFVDGKLDYCIKPDHGPHEASFLSLDNSKIKKVFGWKPWFTFEEAVEMTAQWYLAWANGQDAIAILRKQIKEHFE